MNRLFSALKFLLGGCILSLALSCTKDSIKNSFSDGTDKVKIDFFIGNNEANESSTKITSITASNESKINRWAVFVFDYSTQNLVFYGTKSSSANITAIVESGRYFVDAVVNYPTSGTGAFTPSSVTTRSGLRSTISYLANNSTTNLVMYGTEDYTFIAGDNGTKNVRVKRIATKFGIKKITVNMSRPADAAKTFVLKGVYVTNAYSRCRLGLDYSSSDISATRNQWYNTMGWNTSGSCTSPSLPTAILGDTNIDATISANGGSHTTPHYFYAYPNAVTVDSDASTWSKRCTRMVIEATLDGKTMYYQINLPGTTRNSSYIADEAIIKRAGGVSPESDETDAIEVKWSTSIDDWNPVTAVNETS